MRILLWHGYLLRGSGSNVYTANIAREWRKAGHDVLVLCQESDFSELDLADEAGEFAPDNRSFACASTGVPSAAGRCRIARPAIGRVLPVYVFDEYEGFDAKLYVDLTAEELDHYTSTNVTAMVTAIEEHRPDAIVTGHEVMGPYIARDACAATGRTYVAKLHGSALEYAVKPQSRYRRFARDGLNGAAAVVGGSSYMIEAASTVVGGWSHKARVINPGCDVELFQPRRSARVSSPTVGFVGKLIPSKGVHHLLAALGLTSTPKLKAVIVGYGGWENELRELASALRGGDLSAAIRVAEGGGADELARFLESVRDDAGYLERMKAIEVSFTGRLEHDPLAEVLPGFDLLVVPSVLPEAFGMVAAEAAACGVLPVVPGHSGIREAGAAIEEAIGKPGFLTFDPSDPIRGIASAIDRVLATEPAVRWQMEERAVEVARRRWSWPHVAAELLEVATHG